MKFFTELGMRIEKSWHAEDFDESRFPDVAMRSLAESRPSDHVSMHDIIDWAMTARTLNRTNGFDTKFGQPPVTVFSTSRFYIEVLFWLDSTTSIHQHRFSGAFHVMNGSSLHSQYEFNPTRRYNDQLLIGDLALREIEHLEKGAIRPIYSGNKTIHALFHLDHPSISIVVRTPSSPLGGPQLSYITDGLAFDPFYSNESLFLRKELLRVLHELKDPSFDARAVRAVREADAFEACLLMQYLPMVISDPSRCDQLFDDILPAHAELTAKARLAAESMRRESQIIQKRAAIKEKDHRFFLALLLNVRSRREVLRLVEQVYPGMDPIDRVVQWAEELSKETGRDPISGEATTLLGVPMGDGEVAVFRHLLSGATNEAVVERMLEEFDADDVAAQRQDLIDLCDAFRNSALFRGMLATG